MAAAVRAKHPAGVDGLFDAALLGDEAAALVKDGGGVAAVRRAQQFDAHNTKRLRITYVGVMDDITNTEAIQWIADRARRKVLTPRVAHRIPMSEASKAHRLVEQGGFRGRVVLVT